MGKMKFELMLLEGCAVRQRLQWNCNTELDWNEVKSQFVKIARPFNVVSIRYKDSDGDLVTIADGDDYREAIKNAAVSEVPLSVILDVEKSDENGEEIATHTMSVSTSEASVSTLVSTFSDSVDLSSFKKEIVESVLDELRKNSPKKSAKKKSTKSPKSSQPYCGACTAEISSGNVYYKCANCKCFFLCEDCEQRNQHTHSKGHVFLKLRETLKPQFTNKALVKPLILQHEAAVVGKTTSTPASTASVSTSADLIHFFDSAQPNASDQPTKPRQDSMSLAREMDFISTSMIQGENEQSVSGNNSQIQRERTTSESTFASVANEPEHQSNASVSNVESDAEEEEDDFLVVPLPPCFDLEKPLISLPLPKVEKTDTYEQPPVQQTTPGVEKGIQAAESNLRSLEAAVQHDLECLAHSMSVSPNINQEETPVTPITPPEPVISPPQAVPEPVILPPQAVPEPAIAQPQPVSVESPMLCPSAPSPPSLVHQAASIFDSTPASISLAPRPPMDQLIEMGFGNRRLNQQLLEMYNGCLEQVVTDLISREDTLFQWY